MKVFCYYLKEALLKEFSVDVDVFVSKKRRHVHITFKIPIPEYQSFDQLIEFIAKEWGKNFFSDYKMTYPRLINPMRWWDGNLIMLEKLCNKTVDVINETLTKKYHFVKISQSKKGHIYLIVKKKEEDWLVNKNASFTEILLMY